MLKIDLHIHTIASGHGFSTINEIAKHASEKGMKVIGIADHGPSLNSTNTHWVYYDTLPRVPKHIGGVRILKGIEANIINQNGEIDLKDETIEKLDFAMAGFHIGAPYIDGGVEKNTEAMKKAMKNKHIKIIAHPYFDVKYRIDIEKVSEEACKKGVFLEVNASEFHKKRFRDDKRYLENLKKMIKIVKKYKKKVIVNSDAHWVGEVGDDSVLEEYKEKIGLTDDMIINNYPEELEKLLGVRF